MHFLNNKKYKSNYFSFQTQNIKTHIEINLVWNNRKVRKENQKKNNSTCNIDA